MFIIFPSDNETGTLSNLASDFETARYYTIASIIEDTLADTKIKQGFPSPPPEGEWGRLLGKLKIEVVVARGIKQGTVASMQSSGIRVIRGAKGLVGDMIDWIADAGIDEFEEKVTSLAKQPPSQDASKGEKKLDPVVRKAEPPQKGTATGENGNATVQQKSE